MALEPQLKAMPGKMERGGVAFKVRGFGKRHNFFLVLKLYGYFFCRGGVSIVVIFGCSPTRKKNLFLHHLRGGKNLPTK